MIRDLGAAEAAKLGLIESIAQSQVAMARIMSSMADITEHSETTARHLAENIKVLTKYQDAMARTVCGITLHRVYYGTPTLPWITKACYPANVDARGEQEDYNHGKNKAPAEPPVQVQRNFQIAKIPLG
ncbi:hypothetical protein D3C74_369060 [compost metagenome]